ncbi:5-deoxy-glucuronate isomerase [Salinifilum aidingensis]
MTDQQHYLPAGSAARHPYSAHVDPDSAGWGYSSLRVLELAPGQEHEYATGDSEWIILSLSGGCTVECDGQVHDIAGRGSVFTGVSDFVYVPRDAQVRVRSSGGGRFALTGARCDNRLPVRYGPASDVPVELRGAGQSSRQVNNFGAAHVFEADKLIAVEVLTPAANWSSFPPHKHDEEREGEAELEEIYYFEIAEAGGTPGMGYQRVAPSGPGSTTDVLAEVRTGDVVLIPDGWHGPSMAVPGYDMYYLNVMAGPSPERVWRICDDPAHAWVRDTWAQQDVDPRLPLYRAPQETAVEGR